VSPLFFTYVDSEPNARRTTADASLPLLHPIRGVDGRDITSVHVPKGTDVFINILGSNHLRLTWGKDASKWNPERWLAPLPETVTENRSISGVYSHMYVSSLPRINLQLNRIYSL
jgi:hypothetical protein